MYNVLYKHHVIYITLIVAYSLKLNTLKFLKQNKLTKMYLLKNKC